MHRKRNFFYTVSLIVLKIGFVGSFLWGVVYVLGATDFSASLIQYESSLAGVGEVAGFTSSVPNQPFPSLKYHLIPNNELAYISAKSFVVGDLDTGKIIFSNDAERSRPIASISKLMTALVAKEYMSPTGTIFVSKEAKVGQCTSDLKVGNKIALNDMLYPLLLASDNEAAEAIAITYGRGDFVKLMNAKASELGLPSMRFSDPSGLSPKNSANANDLFLFSKYLYENRNDIISITKAKRYKIPDHNWVNIGKFIDDEDYLGGKNGYTDEAGRTIIAIFKEKIGQEYHNIAFVLLDGVDNKNDIAQLRTFIKKYVETY